MPFSESSKPPKPKRAIKVYPVNRADDPTNIRVFLELPEDESHIVLEPEHAVHVGILLIQAAREAEMIARTKG